MEAQIVDRETYDRTTQKLVCVYNTSAFCELNRKKVDDIKYILIYKDSSPRFGGVFGEVEREWRCPFSAPFGYLEPLKKNQKVSNFEAALSALEKLAKQSGCQRITMTLPPDFYDPSVINTWEMLLSNIGWIAECTDLNFALNLEHIGADYKFLLAYNARRNLKIAFRSALEIWECKTEEEKRTAYRIIKENRMSKGYPLRMSENQVMRTIQIVPSKMYVIRSDEKDIASALIYEVTEDKAQIIYWGEISGCSEKKPMNYLAYELVQLYLKQQFSWIDIGPSTENGKPNYGLCDFKDSIGCQRTSKHRFYQELSV